jgi:GNAT superfamily N-acetyltransferase
MSSDEVVGVDGTRYVITRGIPSPEERQFLEDRIYDYNSARTGHDDGRPFGFFLRNERHEILAGLDGWTWAQASQILNFWVHADLRGQGYGRALLESAEQEAIARGCAVIALNSYSFQSPSFYEKHGYVLVHQLIDFPPGHADNWLVKRLQL